MSADDTQTAIATLSGLAVLLVAMGGRCERWGFAIGLLGQPFWFAELRADAQWGMWLVTLLVTVGYAIGVLRTWVWPPLARRLDALLGDSVFGERHGDDRRQ